MPLTLGDFKTNLRRAHKRGSALDADLDGAIRRAAHWIEANYTLQYMRRRFLLSVAAGDDEVPVPDVNIKAFLTPILWTNALGADGKPSRCVKVDFEDQDWSDPYRAIDGTGVPMGFYLDGVSTICFTSGYSGYTTLAGRGFLSRFSDFPIEDDESHWLIRFGESALLTQSMMELAVINTRDERSYQMYMTQREDQMRVMLNADYETRYSGQDISL